MNTDTNHPAIIDHAAPTVKVSFLDWVQQQGYHVELTTEGTWITATLVGTRDARHALDSRHTRFQGRGTTKEQAIEALMNACSGSEHCPEAGLRYRGFVHHFGPEYQFPAFVTP